MGWGIGWGYPPYGGWVYMGWGIGWGYPPVVLYDRQLSIHSFFALVVLFHTPFVLRFCMWAGVIRPIYIWAGSIRPMGGGVYGGWVYMGWGIGWGYPLVVLYGCQLSTHSFALVLYFAAAPRSVCKAPVNTDLVVARSFCK